MKRTTAATLLFSLLAAPVLANTSCPTGICGNVPQPTIPSPTTPGEAPIAPGDSTDLTNSSNEANSNQSTENNLNQEQIGSQSNVQINNTNIGNFSFGSGVTCSTSQLAVNGNLTGLNGGSSGYSVGVSYLVPLGRSVARNCANLSGEILKQRKYDTQFVLVEKCLAFKAANVNFTSPSLGDLGPFCSALFVNQVVIVQPEKEVVREEVKVQVEKPKVCKTISDQRRKDLTWLTKKTLKDGVISKSEGADNAKRYNELVAACYTNEQIWRWLDP